MVYKFMTPSKLWADYDPEALPLDVKVVEETEEGGVSVKKLFFTSEEAQDGPVRVFCRAAVNPSKSKKAAVLYVGDLFSGGDAELKNILASAGYLVLDVDLGGRFDDFHTLYPESLSYGKPDSGSPYFLKAQPSAKDTSWYLWAKIIKRAAKLLRSEFGIANIALIAENTSSTAAYMAGGTDKSFAAVGTVFGSGYMAYSGMYKYGGENLFLDEERQCFIAGIEAQTYAKFYDKPVLILLSTNGSFGDFDRAMDLFDSFGADKTLVTSPRLRDRITEAAARSLVMWLDRVFKGGTVLRETPVSVIVTSENKYYLNVTTSDTDGLSGVAVYYSTTNTSPYYREWKSVSAEETSGGEYIAMLDTEKNPEILFAFANVSYSDGTLVSSRTAVRLRPSGSPQELDGKIRSRIIYSRDTGINFTPSYGCLIAKDDAVRLLPGACGIKGITCSEGGMINYVIGSSDTSGRVIAVQLDVFSPEKKTVVFGLHIYGSGGADGKYVYRCDLEGSAEWTRLSLEPRMFKGAGLKILDGFKNVRVLEIENAAGVLFNNILFI